MIMDFTIMITIGVHDRAFYDHVLFWFWIWSWNFRSMTVTDMIMDFMLLSNTENSPASKNFCGIAPFTIVLGWKVSSFQESSIALTPDSRSECSLSHSIRPRHHRSSSYWIARATSSCCPPVATSDDPRWVMESWMAVFDVSNSIQLN